MPCIVCVSCCFFVLSTLRINFIRRKSELFRANTYLFVYSLFLFLFFFILFLFDDVESSSSFSKCQSINMYILSESSAVHGFVVHRSHRLYRSHLRQNGEGRTISPSAYVPTPFTLTQCVVFQKSNISFPQRQTKALTLVFPSNSYRKWIHSSIDLFGNSAENKNRNRNENKFVLILNHGRSVEPIRIYSCELSKLFSIHFLNAECLSYFFFVLAIKTKWLIEFLFFATCEMCVQTCIRLALAA